MDWITPIKLEIVDKLKNDESYRKAFFRAQTTDSIALQIRDLRKRRGSSQAKLAQDADMKQSAVSRIEQAEYSAWTFKTLWRVAEALKARIIVTFQPMEEAIIEHEHQENSADKTSYVMLAGSRVSARTIFIPFTEHPRSLTVSDINAPFTRIREDAHV